MKKFNFTNANIIIENGENGIQPAIFIIENRRIYMVTITPDHKFYITDEGLIGDRYELYYDNNNMIKIRYKKEK